MHLLELIYNNVCGVYIKKHCFKIINVACILYVAE